MSNEPPQADFTSPEEISKIKPISSGTLAGSTTAAGEASRPPRFGILQMMILTASVALLVSLGERIKELSAQSGSTWWVYDDIGLQVFGFLDTICSGAGLAGMFWLVRWRARPKHYRLQPGHWILFSWGLSILFAHAMYLVMFSLADYQWKSPNTWLWFVYALSSVGLAVLYLVAFFRQSGAWKWWFGVLSSQTFIALIWGNLGVLTWLLKSLVGIWVIVIVAIDIRQNRSRDWIHYFGVFMFLASVLVRIAYGVYVKYFYILN